MKGAKGKKKAIPARGKKARLASVPSDPAPRTKIRVIGIGGGGGNILSEISGRVTRVDFAVANTDAQSLKAVPRKVRTLNFGYEVTRGLGAGMDPELGRKAAELDRERIKKLCEGQDICVFVACLGGGTASGAAPVFAEVCRELGVLSVGILAMPFGFEGKRREEIAREALGRITPFLNAYCVVPNERIFQIIEKSTPLKQALSLVNRRLSESLEGLIDMLALPGLINIDFADVRSMLEGREGLAYISTVTAGGENRSADAIRGVTANPLLEYDMTGMERILFHVSGDRSLRMQETGEISRAVSAFNPKARIIFGISVEPRMKSRMRVTVFGVGRPKEEEKKREKPRRKPAPKAPKGDLKEQGPAPEAKKQEPEPSAQDKQEKIKKKDSPKKKPKAPSASPDAARKEEKPEGNTARPSPAPAPEEPATVRRNALDVHRAIDREIQALEENEDKWDVPAFLRNRQT